MVLISQLKGHEIVDYVWEWNFFTIFFLVLGLCSIIYALHTLNVYGFRGNRIVVSFFIMVGLFVGAFGIDIGSNRKAIVKDYDKFKVVITDQLDENEFNKKYELLDQVGNNEYTIRYKDWKDR